VRVRVCMCVCIGGRRVMMVGCEVVWRR
jgi:hypothetical protein